MRLTESHPTGSLPRTTFPLGFFRIRLELACEISRPASNPRHGYVFVAPLDPDGRIDSRLWQDCRDECRVVQFYPNAENIGHLIRRPNGDWAFQYDVRGSEGDEIEFRFGRERFVAGEYVFIEEGGTMRIFKITTVEHV